MSSGLLVISIERTRNRARSEVFHQALSMISYSTIDATKSLATTTKVLFWGNIMNYYATEDTIA